MVPAVVYLGGSGGSHGVPVRDGSQQVSLPADRTFGLYVDDPDNSGYAAGCTATDADGRLIAMRMPG
jgi:hypothetical protein